MNAPASTAIMIVEDEAIFAMDLRASLNSMGYDAFAIAASGAEAMSQASVRQPDVVLMDIRIKGERDGIDIAALLKDKFCVDVIYLTAHADEAMLDRAKRTEPQGYLLKPVKMAELRSMLDIVVYRRRLERARETLTEELRRAHARVRDLVRRLEQVREEERRAVAVMLHDGIAQDLFAVKLGLAHLQSRAASTRDAAAVFAELNDALTKCMDDMRQLANDLRPVALAQQGIAKVLDDHARRFGELAQLHVSVVASPDLPALDESLQLLLFRAAQEALTNVARHASASTVTIHLSVEAGRLILDVTDDGIGIAAGDTQKARSLGLLALGERFADLGGELILERCQPHGTRLRAVVPLEPALTAGTRLSSRVP